MCSFAALSATTPVPNGGLESPYEMGSSGLARPIYPRTQYNIPHAHVTIDAAHPGKDSGQFVCSSLSSRALNCLIKTYILFYSIFPTQNFVEIFKSVQKNYINFKKEICLSASYASI